MKTLRVGLITVGGGGVLLLAWLWLRPPPPPSDGLLQLPGNTGSLTAPAPGTAVTPPAPPPTSAPAPATAPLTGATPPPPPANTTGVQVAPPLPSSPGGAPHALSPAEIAGMNARSKDMTVRLLDQSIRQSEEQMKAASAAGKSDEVEIARARIENWRKSQARLLQQRDDLLKEQERLQKGGEPR